MSLPMDAYGLICISVSLAGKGCVIPGIGDEADMRSRLYTLVYICTGMSCFLIHFVPRTEEVTSCYACSQLIFFYSH